MVMSHHPKYWHLTHQPHSTKKVNYYHVLVTLVGVLFSESTVCEEGHSLMLQKPTPIPDIPKPKFVCRF